jgi:hypothetical protein
MVTLIAGPEDGQTFFPSIIHIHGWHQQSIENSQKVLFFSFFFSPFNFFSLVDLLRRYSKLNGSALATLAKIRLIRFSFLFSSNSASSARHFILFIFCPFSNSSRA